MASMADGDKKESSNTLLENFRMKNSTSLYSMFSPYVDIKNLFILPILGDVQFYTQLDMKDTTVQVYLTYIKFEVSMFMQSYILKL